MCASVLILVLHVVNEISPKPSGPPSRFICSGYISTKFGLKKIWPPTLVEDCHTATGGLFNDEDYLGNSGKTKSHGICPILSCGGARKP
ncbi:hypothetical protein F5X98DRAFT_341598 [Xylaria grammica]|nr:hypothetical protein F5X98DRAFT_341598 [Xylaria grammica]